MRNVRRDVGYINCGVRDFFPEAESVGAGVIADQIQSDTHEPGGDRAVTAEAIARRPGSNEGVLGQGLRHIAVTDGDQMESEDSLLIGGNDGVHIIEHRCRGLRGEVRLPRDGESVGAKSL